MTDASGGTTMDEPAAPITAQERHLSMEVIRGAALFGTVLYDPEEGAFKMWYLCSGGLVAFAVSGDGVAWE